jgi:serine phosphatase RsbU (regulator of sigma subunit)
MNSLMTFLGKLVFSRRTAPEVTRRNTRAHLIQPLKERIVREVGYGLSLDGASAADLVKSMRTKAEPAAERKSRLKRMENPSSAQLFKKTEPEEYDLAILGKGAKSKFPAWILAGTACTSDRAQIPRCIHDPSDEVVKDHRAEGASPRNSLMVGTYTAPTIDEYLRKRLMPVEGAIPHLPGIQMYGNSIPAGTVGGDLFEYINFQQRYDIDARIQRALKLSKEFLAPTPPGGWPRNSVDDHVEWLKSRPGHRPTEEVEYRAARSSEQLRVAEDLKELHSVAGVLLVDAQGHGIISAKIASTVHDTLHALMLSELDHRGRTTPALFERLNLRLAKSITARNALGRSEQDDAREIATMLYGEVHLSGHFRFVNFGHPPPLVFSADLHKFTQIDRGQMVQFPPLGLEIPEDHPDRNLYFSSVFRQEQANSSDVADIKLISPGDILFLYTDGVYDGSDVQERQLLEGILRKHCLLPPKDICSALMDYALRRDDQIRQAGEQDRIDDKTVFIIKRK